MMRPDRAPLTPEQARERLAVGHPPSLGTPGDRTVHAVSTAVLGLAISFAFTTRNVTSEPLDTVLFCVVALLCVADVIWVERTVRTVPRRAKLWSWLGMGASVVLSLGVLLPWLNLQAQTEPNTWPMVVAAGVVAAVPSLIAAAAILRVRR